MITDAYTNMMPIDLERELSIYRSGSAPPTVEGALAAVGGLLDGAQLHGVDKIGYRGVMSEEELRADPAYVNYYYSNVKLNPRLPPPHLSKNDLRFAQMSGGGAVGGDRKAVGRGEGSLFSVQPGFGSQEENANQGLELRPGEWGGGDGLIGLPGFGIGSRKKSIAEMIQDDMNHGTASSRHPSRPASRNTFGDSIEMSDLQLQRHSEMDFLDPAHSNANKKGVSIGQSIGTSASHTYASALSASLSRSATPDPQLVDRVPTPRIPPVGVGRVGSMDKRIINGQGSFNGVSSGMSDSADLVNALAGLNLTADGILDEESHSQSRMHNQIDDQHEFYGFNKEFQKPAPTLPSSFVKGPSTPLTGHNYGIGGHAANPLSPSMMASQLGHANLPPLLKNVATASALGINGLDPRALGGSSLQNLGRVTGAAMQFPLMDSSFLQYSRSNEYTAAQLAGVIDPILDRDAMGNSYADLLGLQKAYLDALLASQKSQYSIPYLGKSGGFGNGYNGNLACAMGMSYPGSPLASPPFPNSPSRHGERNVRYHSGARSMGGGFMGAWHSDVPAGLDENFALSLLDEFKSNKAKCFELSEIAGHVVEFSADQYGSRFIQQKLETASTEEKDMVFHEIMPRALSLMTDVFGNYVIQKFFEHGSAAQIRELAEQLYGHVLTLSLQMYGCRVIQKAIEVVELDQQTVMVKELDGHVMRCVRDQNGNHVIQKCIECIPEDAIQFIVSVFYDQVVVLSTHPYGCRVIQRILEHCNDPKTQQIMMDEILLSVCMLAQDQYGNYVVQHVLEHGKPHERTAIIKKLTGQIVHMSQQKFASNVIEKCLAFGTPVERQTLVNEMLGATDENDPLQVMMKDQYANYVVQKVLETCDDQQLELILNRIKIHLNALKKYTYGKHIVARVEKLVAAGERRISIQNPHASTTVA